MASDLILAVSPEAGVYLAASRDGKHVFVTGHAEYDADTLKNEYERDKAKGLPVTLPRHYFPDDNPTQEPLVTTSLTREDENEGTLRPQTLSDYIGQEKAKEAALKHAGVSESQVSGLRVQQDWDDGRLEYEVEFWVDTTEYEYTVDGATGDIRKSEREPHPSASSADIGQEQAVSIALAHAGLSQSQVYGLEAEREWEDDHLEYQVEFKAGGMEYSYDIAASDGAILSFEREKD
mgnify:CR=1 FL=1